MEIKKLRLLGFKSFVEPTEVNILPGLTGIVGPNGCGKSNIIDAFQWLMGESRPSSMRASGMDDVIFSGVATRPKRNFAEVVLEIDNNKKLAPGEFNRHSEIEISRKITREIGSSYKLNGKEIRARDVQTLFADIATGSNSSGLIKQGQIAELLNMKPKDRKRILEEAAGISGLHHRRHEAELKLRATERNLDRLQDLISQLETQLRLIEKQAREAERYSKLSKDIRDLKGIYLLKQYLENRRKLDESDLQLGENIKKVSNFEKNTLGVERQIEELQSQLPEVKDDVAEKSKKTQNLLLEKQAISNKIRLSELQLEELKQLKSQNAIDFDRENQLLKDAEIEVKALSSQLEEIDKRIDGLGNSELDDIKNQKNLEDQYSSLEKDYLDCRQRLDHLRAEKVLKKERIEENVSYIAELKQSIELIKSDLNDSKSAEQQALSNLELNQETLKELKIKLAGIEKNLAQKEKVQDDLEKNLALVIENLNRENLNKNMLMSEVEVSKNLTSVKDTGPSIIDDLKVEEGYEPCLDAIFVSELDYPKRENNLASGWREMIEKRSESQINKHFDGLESLSKYVKGEKILIYLLDHVGIVEDIEQGNNLSKRLVAGQYLVTKKGDLWRWDGFVKFSTGEISKNALKINTQKKIKKLTQDIEISNSRIVDCESNKLKLEKSLQENGTLTKDKEIITGIKAEIDKLIGEIGREDNKKKIIFDNIKSLEQNLSSETKRLSALTIEGHDNDKVDNEDFENADNEKLLILKLNELEKKREIILIEKTKFEKIATDKKYLIDRKNELKITAKEWKERLKTASKRQSELSERKRKLESEIHKNSELPQTLLENEKNIQEKIKLAENEQTEADDRLASIEGQIRRCQDQNREFQKSLGLVREEQMRIKTIKESLLEKKSNYEVEIKGGFEGSVEEFVNTFSGKEYTKFSTEEIETLLERQTRLRDALGSVNLRAEQDAQEIREQLGTILSEKNDVLEAVEKLNKAVRDLNKDGRQKLLKAFEEINKTFNELFSKLFQGGKGELVLVDSKDPLEAGLEILCQPPGKKLTTLSLLSGGEQTLTALALIFSVFLVNPSPVCLMDEVDAPLDEANILKYCDILDYMVRKTETRFLVITHNIITITRMNRLYGVTMMEPGVSQLVGVDLSKAEQLIG